MKDCEFFGQKKQKMCHESEKVAVIKFQLVRCP